MHSEKKMTKEDTWRPDELQKHIWSKSDFQGHGYNEDAGRKKDKSGPGEDVKKIRRGGSGERRHRVQEKTSHRERDGPRERSVPRNMDKKSYWDTSLLKTSHKDLKDRDGDSPLERVTFRDTGKDRYQDGIYEKKQTHRDLQKYSNQDRHKHETRTRTAERDVKEQERERTDEGSRKRDRVKEGKDRETGNDRERERRDRDSEGRNRERERREREKEGKDRERERRDREKEGRDRERERRDRGHDKTDKNRNRVRERRKEDRDRELVTERDQKKGEERDREKVLEKKGEKDRYAGSGQSHSSKHMKESNRYEDRGRDFELELKRENERGERQNREHSRPKEDIEYREHRRREKEERERRRRKQEESDARESQMHDVPRDSKAVHKDTEQHGRRRVQRHREVWDSKSDLAETTVTNRRRSTREDLEKVDRDSQQLAELEDHKEAVFTETWPSEGQGQDEVADEYEDDFEDYEEDFEETDESEGTEQADGDVSNEGEDVKEMSLREREEVEAIQRAMEAENKQLGSALQRPLSEEHEDASRGRAAGSSTSQSRGPVQGRFIDFVAAKHREVSKKVSSKQKKRSTELLRLIDLDFSVTLSLLDLPPVNEYDMYIKAFGTTNTKQAYVQCNEDSVERDVQTEDTEMSDRWTQHPGDRGVVCGGPKLSSSEVCDERKPSINGDTQRLAAFLLSASQVMSVLLEEDRAEQLSERPRLQSDTLSFSDGGLQLSSSVPFLHDREVSLIVFSQVQRQTMLSVHRPSAKPTAVRMDSKTILCVWNIWEPSRPQKILVYESEVRCCCFSPGKATLVFAGTTVGSLVLWDLREHSSLHCTIKIGEQDWTLCYPTFSTDAVLADSGHHSSVTSLEPVPPAVVETQRPGFTLVSSQEESSGLSFQLASLDENGILNIWVVVELLKIEQAGSQTDLGLIPGGKVKLLHSSTIAAFQRFLPADVLNMGPIQSLILRFLPSDSSHFFIGTNMSLVTHGTRHGSRSPPLIYRPRMAGFHPAQVTSLDFSPFGEPLFLVGCDDGSVRLHSLASEAPVMEWSISGAARAVVSAQWSFTRPAVFCVLDSASVIYMWDLLQKDFEPVVLEKVHPNGVTTMAVFGDPSKQNTFSGLVLTKQSGKIEIQYLSRTWTVPSQDELEKVRCLVCEAY